MYIPDKFSKTVTIPIRIVDGKVEYYYDNEAKLTEIKNLSYAELTIPKSSFIDEGIIKKLTREQVVDFIQKDTKLYAQVRMDDTQQLSAEEKKLIHHFVDVKGLNIEGGLIEIVLADDLKLLLRGSKRARLEACKCQIPILDSIEAMSINQAYTLISQKVEPSRRSHSGNVFDKIYYLNNGACKKIDVLRCTSEAKYEEENLIVKKGE